MKLDYKTELNKLDERTRELNSIAKGREKGRKGLKNIFQSKIVQLGGIGLLSFGLGMQYRDRVLDSYQAVSNYLGQETQQKISQIEEIAAEKTLDHVMDEIQNNPKYRQKFQSMVKGAFASLPEETKYDLLLEGIKGMSGKELSSEQLYELKDAAMKSGLVKKILTLPYQKDDVREEQK